MYSYQCTRIICSSVKQSLLTEATNAPMFLVFLIISERKPKKDGWYDQLDIQSVTFPT